MDSFKGNSVAKVQRRFTNLSAYLAANEIQPLAYLRDLIRGEAPPPVLIDGEIYLPITDLVRWQTRLTAEAHSRALRIMTAGGVQ